MRGRVAGVLLAAGESRRMGAVNKLSLEVGGLPLVRRTALTLLGSALTEVVAVVGHGAETARALLDGLPLRVVENPHYREGQMTSVHCGLEALREPCDGVMICLCDQPLLESADIDILIGAFLNDCPRSVLVPTYEGQRGNPVVLSHRHRETILAGGRNLGCRRLIDKNPELVWALPMATDHCVVDLDTPEDYQRLKARLRAGAASEPGLQDASV
jgi:molybdenum cofactor cytidylyltransferase